jgi:TPR repeat protein
MGGCAALGLSYENGAGVTKDLNRAAALYKQACDGGEEAVCDFIASCETDLGGGGVCDVVAGRSSPTAPSSVQAQALSPANAYYKEACHHGLDRSKDRPQDVPPDLRTQSDACFYLGRSHENGWGGALKDQRLANALYSRGHTLYTRACNDGAGPAAARAVACANHGFNILNGMWGLSKDKIRAKLFLKKACQLGAKHVCHFAR